MKTADFNRFSLEMPDDCVGDCSHVGPCDDDVSHWAAKLPRPADISPEALRAELKEYGAWDAEQLADDAANWERLVWVAACNIKEESKGETTHETY